MKEVEPPSLNIMTSKKFKRDKNGFVAFLSVIIIGAAVFIMAFYSSMLGVGELDLGYTSQMGSRAFSTADGCTEEVLRRIRLDANYGLSGQINLSVPDGSCIINISDIGGNQRNITILGTSGVYNKKTQTTITISGDAVSGNIITLNSWQENND